MNDNHSNDSAPSDEGPVSARRVRPRRRQRKPLILDNTVPSPCLSICRFDGKPFCVGCYRNVDEIREWMIMTREQKLAVLEQLEQRRLEQASKTKSDRD